MMKIPKSLHETCAGDHPDSCIAVYHARTGKSGSNIRVNKKGGSAVLGDCGATL